LPSAKGTAYLLRMKHRVLGIMSGTSLDGVDYALCEISEASIKLKRMWSVEYPAELKAKLMAAASDNLSSYGLSQLHHDLGRFYAQKAPNVGFDYIGLHGQTIFHNPTKNTGATFQLGEPAYLAARFGVPVVNQFRTMDLALGGQGAPLATLFHREVFARKNLNVAVNNLGGISNVTYLPKAGGKILSFDTGPANILIDGAVAHFTKRKLTYDKNGDYARRGIAHTGLIERWLKHPFFTKRPPKSTGREEFSFLFLKKALAECQKLKLDSHSAVATLTGFTAASLALNYEKHLPQWPDVVVLCGGGSQNPTLVKAISYALRERQWLTQKSKSAKPIEVVTSAQWGWPTQSIEASAFALLAYRTINHRAGNIPQTTGAKRAAVLGSITPAP
jgi:anhydro-N-acetylmuramic acid kinase